MNWVLQGMAVTRGVSKQQKEIVDVLKREDGAFADSLDMPAGVWFSTPEILAALHPSFEKCRWGGKQWRKPYDKHRLSIRRALTSLRRGGIVASIHNGGTRYWALRERLPDDWEEGDDRQEYVEFRSRRVVEGRKKAGVIIEQEATKDAP